MYVSLIKVINKMSGVLISKTAKYSYFDDRVMQGSKMLHPGTFHPLVISYLCKISPTILLHLADVFTILDMKSYLSDNQCHICKHTILWMSLFYMVCHHCILATVFMIAQISNLIKWNDWHSFSFVKQNPIPPSYLSFKNIYNYYVCLNYYNGNLYKIGTVDVCVCLKNVWWNVCG